MPKKPTYEELEQGVKELEKEVVERGRLEEALRESEECLRSLFSMTAEGVVLIDTDGQILQANPAAEHILGLKRSEIEGHCLKG